MVYSAVILDIEGTVCPIAFVKDTLFPYFLRKVPTLVTSQDPVVRSLLGQFGTEQVENHIRKLVDRDVKDPILKQLQGYVWEEGYKSGEIRAPVYNDAVKFIQDVQVPIYIYSSGSVKAQKLLFAHVDTGKAQPEELCSKLSGFFDITTSGRKTDKQSYLNIISEINRKAETVLFVSDNVLELEAATKAGLRTMLAVRPGNAPIPKDTHFVEVRDFEQIKGF
ncbi:LAFE_0B10990g1_1 [Lachancea fermentati]|uniref:Enolase-phosphatase E1 n=1 Tax=Lachancea fermentati TaxID=4955 RepID=A0A1G4M8J6_LACFM|nr:LAFE_0B10990g1_1 [Lachancea fermentati]